MAAPGRNPRERLRATATHGGPSAKTASHRKDHDLVFPSSVSAPLFHRNLVRAFKDLLGRAGLPGRARLYDQGHTCATLLLAGNVHPKDVQKLLGHPSIELTLDTYSPAWMAARRPT